MKVCKNPRCLYATDFHEYVYCPKCGERLEVINGKLSIKGNLNE